LNAGGAKRWLGSLRECCEDVMPQKPSVLALFGFSSLRGPTANAFDIS
jgi:hypothetical protein